MARSPIFACALRGVHPLRILMKYVCVLYDVGAIHPDITDSIDYSSFYLLKPQSCTPPNSRRNLPRLALSVRVFLTRSIYTLYRTILYMYIP